MENYDPVKKQMMGLPPTPAQTNRHQSTAKKASNYSLWNAMTSSYTWIPFFSFFAFAIAYASVCATGFFLWLQRNSFIIVLLTLVPLAAAVVTSSAGKALGNMTPWEPSKIPFLVGFAGILTARYKDLAETYWGIPRARDIVPLACNGSDAFYSVLCAERLWTDANFQRRLHDAIPRRGATLATVTAICRSVLLVIGILVVGALPRDIQEKVPLLPTIARPIRQHFLREFSNASISGSTVSIRHRRKFHGGRKTTTKHSQGSRIEGTGRTKSRDAEDCQRRYLV